MADLIWKRTLWMYKVDPTLFWKCQWNISHLLGSLYVTSSFCNVREYVCCIAHMRLVTKELSGKILIIHDKKCCQMVKRNHTQISVGVIGLFHLLATNYGCSLSKFSFAWNCPTYSMIEGCLVNVVLAQLDFSVYFVCVSEYKYPVQLYCMLCEIHHVMSHSFGHIIDSITWCNK